MDSGVKHIKLKSSMDDSSFLAGQGRARRPEAPAMPRGQGSFEPADGFGPAYRRFFDLDLGQRFAWFEHGGQRLASQRFEPTGAVRGSAVVVHGYYDHIGLYGHLIRYLLGRGLRVFAYDQQGHGLSTGCRATIDSFDRYASALAAYVRTVPEPRWILGQSMGASVILETLDSQLAPPLDRVLLLAPLVRPARWLAGRLSYAFGRHFLNRVERKFAANTDNPEFIQLVRSDPLQPDFLPVQWVAAMIDWKRRFEARAPSCRPVAVIQGGRDGTVDAAYNLQALRRRYAVELLAIPEARHHLVNETEAIRSRMWRFLDRFELADAG